MDLDESQTHSFIIRIWLEQTAQEAGQAVWRGHITHVSTGERRYVEDLDGILAFIERHLERMGAKPGLLGRLRRWWQRWRRP